MNTQRMLFRVAIGVFGLAVVTAGSVSASAKQTDATTIGEPSTMQGVTGTDFPQPAPLPANPTSDEFDAYVKQYRLANPHDLIGLNDIIVEHTGQEMTTSINGSQPRTSAEAQELYDSLRAQSSIAPEGTMGIAAIPTDSFVVMVQAYNSTTGNGVVIMGSWDWRDDFVGQGDPVDLAAIQINAPDCVMYDDYDAAAGTWDGSIGNDPTLRNAGLDGNAVWNVDAVPVGFENQADRGLVTLTAYTHNCPNGANVGAAFTYEANKGAGVLGVGVGWGILSVSYNGSADVLQKSSEPVYVSSMENMYLLKVLPQFQCYSEAMAGMQDGLWTSFECVRTADLSIFELWVS